VARKIARVSTQDRELRQVQENIITVLDPALAAQVSAVGSTTNRTGAVLQGFLEVETPIGRVFLPYYSKPTGP
jgi:hypothetical protein